MGWFKRGGVTPYERDIIKFVKSHGCFIVSVVPDEGEVHSIPWSYSIGFTKTLGRPEVVLCGLPRDTAHETINLLFAMCRNGLTLEDGQIIDGLFGNGFAVVSRIVDESWLIQSQFASALWFHRTQMDQPLQNVVQLIWPDAEGLFPWDDDCAEWVRNDQPEMYKPRIAA